MKEKLVSIYIPTHNRKVMLQRAIFSVQSQTYKNIEILVCDDGSSDGTEDVVAQLSREDGRIKYFKNDLPKGACSARNLGVFSAKGYYITGLDDDDQFKENRIKNLVNKFEERPCAFICSNIVMNYGSHKSVMGYFCGVIDSDMMGYKNHVGNQLLTKTEYLQDIGGFDERFPAWQDYDVWFRLADRYGPGFKVTEATYIQNVDHELGRITTGKRAKEGYEMFINMHAGKLSPAKLKHLYFQDKMNRSENIKLDELLKNFVLENSKIYIKQLLKNKVPGVKILVNSFKNKDK
ncbi:glycosyltransferase [Serratia proteamaculans]|uniref:glycosyltransferase n=1 Tax=Serratia proteamaculans TaxID=28151 RepID=UPI003D04378A